MNRPGIQRWLVLGLGAMALVSLVLEFGFHLDAETEQWLAQLDVGIAVLFGLEMVVALVHDPLRTLRERWYEYLLLVLFAVAIGALEWMGGQGLKDLLNRLHLQSATKLYLAVIQVFVLLDALVHLLRAQEGLLVEEFRPERVFVGGFALLVLGGTLLLLLPRAGADGEKPIGIVDALFTSTSAVCVTGLVVRDTGHDFTLLGQTVIMMLIQVGGLGIITFVAFLSSASGRAFSIPQLVALRQITNAPTLAEVKHYVNVILLTALGIEGIGAAWLFTTAALGHATVFERVFWALFHSVSAFCNAGFSLDSANMVPFRDDWLVLPCIMGLIIVGGMGAPVVRDLLVVGRLRLLRRMGRLPAEEKVPRLRAQTKFTLILTGLLLGGGALGFAVCEFGQLLKGVSFQEGLLISAFHSVSARTAGFNTVPMEHLQHGTLLVLIFLMVVGAGPVSTGGGIKTLTFGILLLSLRSMVRGSDVEIFGRTVPSGIVRASVCISVSYVLTALLVTFVLCLSDPQVSFVSKLFETVSALSTVGLSTGITAGISTVGKLALCVAMFCGRIGPLALAMTVLRSKSSSASYRYPEESMVLS